MHGHHETISTPTASAWALRIVAACLVGVALAAALSWSTRVNRLEEPASSVRTPNPHKHFVPWYTMSVADVLVYHDPWYAGVLGQGPAPVRFIASMPIVVALPIVTTSLVVTVFAGLALMRRRTIQELQTA